VDLRCTITPVPGAVSIPFAEDFLVSVKFIDSETGAVVGDYSGDKAVLVSTLLASMPAEVLAQLVNETAVRMVAIARGVPM
jgi:hypothetical protein